MKTRNVHEPGDIVLAAWQEQVEQAKEKPWLAALLLRQGERLLGRFAYFYERLRALPRNTRRTIQNKLATTLAGAALLLALSGTPSVHAATITVDGVSCTLAEAITSANNDNAGGNGCVDGSGADTIDLQTDVNLTAVDNTYFGPGSGLPVISSVITIEGNGHTIARTGGPSFRILQVTGGGNLTINQATISGGDATNWGGGAVNNRGGTVVLNNCTVNGNSAYVGGGIHNDYGTLTVNNSTISGNTATASGGGISTYSDTTTLNNSTITGNTAAKYGGGIHGVTGYDGFTLNRSLISGNSASNANEVQHYSKYGGTVNADNYNLFGHNGENNAQAFSGFTPGASDITATSDGANPTALGSILNTSLTDNGGATLTHALVSGSPAIDAAPSAACTAAPTNGIDQRGAARNFDLAGSATANECDIGALEFRESITLGTCSGSPLSGAQNFNFTASSNTVTVNVNTGNGLTCLTAEEMGPGVNHLLATGPGATGVGLQTNNWWHISGDVNSGLDVDITLPYTGADASSRLCKWPGGLGGYGWDCGPLDGTGTSFVANTSVTRSGLSSFSDWAVGDVVGPTAVSLQNISAKNDTGPIAGVLSALSLAWGVVWLRLRRQRKA